MKKYEENIKNMTKHVEHMKEYVEIYVENMKEYEEICRKYEGIPPSIYTLRLGKIPSLPSLYIGSGT